MRVLFMNNKVEQAHIARQIPPMAHTPMYSWHKYWSRKTWNVVNEFIQTYSSEDEIVFDPFGGSGVTAIEALKQKRRVIICDLLPIATEITRLTIKPISEIDLLQAFERVEDKVKDRIQSLYETSCRNCGKQLSFPCAVWEDNQLVEIRYKSCPHCSDRREKDTSPTKEDLRIIQHLQESDIQEWYPRDPLYYPDGKPFKKKEKYESIDDLFTKRNLLASAILMNAIKEEQNKDLRDFLKVGFTSIVHLATKMCPALNASSTNHQTAFSSTWTQHSFWYANRFLEQNVWKLFDSAIKGHQGLINAKKETNKYFKNIVFANSIDKVIDKKADIYIHTGCALKLMESMPSDSVHYVFTDPPYGSSIQYGELAFLWVAWLGESRNYTEGIFTNEVIHNKKQDKDFSVYHSLLKNSFVGINKALKPGRYLTLTFHNPTFKVRNATIRAGVFAGFEFQKIHHQPLGQVSAKSMLQPFGSARGDFYLRFYKPKLGESILHPEEIDEIRFEKIVVETAIQLLAERAEETPYTQIINFIDPVLAKNGFFSILETGLDVGKVLKKHLGKEFVLVKSKIGKSEGELWWLKEPSKYIKYNIPLSERVEETIERELLSKGRTTFTEVWSAVSTRFPNSLTPDSSDIRSSLSQYAKQVSGGAWMLKSVYLSRRTQHNEIISLLAVIGNSMGFKVWIGKTEQRQFADGQLGRVKLSKYVNTNLSKITNAENSKEVEQVDVLWIKNNRIVSVFEVESSTSMTSALNRGSNIDSSVKKYMVLPEERENLFEKKQRSSLFAERFKNDSWNILYFDALRNNFRKVQSGELDLSSLVNTKAKKASSAKIRDKKHPQLF